MTGKRLTVGIVGGGIGSNIGTTHRIGLRLDNRFSLDAAVFGREPLASGELARQLGIADDRIYANYQEMANGESNRLYGVDLVVILTPNDSHFNITKTFLERGFHVVCEKPLSNDVTSAKELLRLARENGVVLAVPHCYSSYAMVRQAARHVRDGALGRVTMIDVEHASGWASTNLEESGHKQASWRTDPAISGVTGVVADLGTHAYHLARFITGLEAESISSQLSTVVTGRRIYDNVTVTMKWQGGATGRLWASMAAAGHLHGLRIRVFGEKGNLEWRHEAPQILTLQDLDGTVTVLTQGMSSLSEDANRLNRVGAGHPEGILEAFANFYGEVADEIEARRDGVIAVARELRFPSGIDGLRGVEFVERVLESHTADGKWLRVAVSPGEN